MYKPMNRVEGMGFVSLAAGHGYINFIFQLSLFSAEKWRKWDLSLASKPVHPVWLFVKTVQRAGSFVNCYRHKILAQ
jgi:hypothetical protein